MKTIGPQLQEQMKRLINPWFRIFLTLDPRPALMRLKAPVLAFNGELDTQVLAEQTCRRSWRRWRRAATRTTRFPESCPDFKPVCFDGEDGSAR